jgi:hypothetical protein
VENLSYVLPFFGHVRAIFSKILKNIEKLYTQKMTKKMTMLREKKAFFAT